MTSPTDDRSPNLPRGWLRAMVVSTLAIAFVGAAAGFLAFLSQLRGAELAPDRKADGIVVLTGGSSRVSDAMELLAAGYGKRLLISGVHPTSTASDISRTLPESQSFMHCCVDLDRTAVSTRGNAAETRRWAQERGFKSLIVVTSNYHMPRALVEFSHAMPEMALIPFAVVGDKWREEPWWTSASTLRLLLSEYVKYIAAELRVRLEDFGVDLAPEVSEQPAGQPPKRPATAQAN
ncbi:MULTISPECIES: YdcF family protein [unclassified Bradyrhizobium]|uniref:YdcF family protein n=1 Tax=unclassified Bradyrhizobium TaxID=2631580 RepID=UPI002479C317|nr:MULTISPECIES: YdcF family protein [unclassified Bradyrhizobium]WGR72261.1 YdcF family protein [Bradyrhizobium sp. ISRA426]WGR77095.1 YdcF family protein [Bradyrhizobium sp. ISRA430]WGR87500.1 YdcF family protein [Bradyrhizobium sp. ISRA432]